VQLALQIQVQVGAEAFEQYRNILVAALANLVGVPPSAVHLSFVQAGLLRRRLLAVNDTLLPVNVTTVDVLLNVQGLNLNSILSLLSPANLNSTLVSLGLPQIFIFTQAYVTSECGNGVVEAPEVCDDGNTLPADGCSFQCTVETGWTCITPSPVQTCAGSNASFSNISNLTCVSSLGPSNGTNSSTGSDQPASVGPSNGTHSSNSTDHTASIASFWPSNGTDSTDDTASICTDINECALNAQLVNMCNSSQANKLNGSKCKPLCDSLSSCVNTPGSFYCQCFTGFVQRNGVCVDDPGNNATLQRDTVFSNQTTAVLTNLSVNSFGYAIAMHKNHLLLGSLGLTDAYLYKKTSPAGWPAFPTRILGRGDYTDGAYGVAVAVYTAEDGSATAGSVHARSTWSCRRR